MHKRGLSVVLKASAQKNDHRRQRRVQAGGHGVHVHSLEVAHRHKLGTKVPSLLGALCMVYPLGELDLTYVLLPVLVSPVDALPAVTPSDWASVLGCSRFSHSMLWMSAVQR
jgi:hypothetical protein